MKKNQWKINDKAVFISCIMLSFITILIYNVLTPYLTDDLSYKSVVDQANSFWELVYQEYEHFIYHTGRNVAHLIMRIFLSMPKMVFNVCNSIAFVMLSFLIYLNVEHKKKYDYRLFLLILGLMWFYAVQFAQTILWLDGACNYLWGAFTIMGFITCYRFLLKKELLRCSNSLEDTGVGRTKENLKVQGKQILVSIGMFLFGLLAGWYNENTSGGGIILVLLFLAAYLWIDHGRIRTYMITGVGGQVTGMLFMLLSPGTAARSALETSEEEHSGVFALVARFQKILLNVDDLFFTLIAASIILLILCIAQKHRLMEFKNAIIYIVGFLATTFALILTPPTQQRAFFGAGIFLFVVIAELYSMVKENEVLIHTIKTGIVAVMILHLFFVYIENGANLMRISRESNERFHYIEDKISENPGIGDIIVAQLRPEFDCRYTCAYEMDLMEDEHYWINVAYEEYYGVGSIYAIPRDEWDAMREQ